MAKIELTKPVNPGQLASELGGNIALRVTQPTANKPGRIESPELDEKELAEAVAKHEARFDWIDEKQVEADRVAAEEDARRDAFNRAREQAAQKQAELAEIAAEEVRVRAIVREELAARR